MENILTGLPEEVAINCIIVYLRPRDRARIWWVCKAIRHLRLIWAGTTSVTVCSDDETPSTIQNSTYFIKDQVPLSAFKEMLPFIKPHLTTLRLKPTLNSSVVFEECMRLLDVTKPPKLSAIVFFQGSLQATGLPRLSGKEEKTRYGKILSSLPSLKDVSIPIDYHTHDSFLRLVCCHVTPALQRICFNGSIYEYRILGLIDDPKTLESIFHTYGNAESVNFDFSRNLHRLWALQITHINIGNTPVRCATFLHSLASHPQAKLSIIESVFKEIGDAAVNVSRPGDDSMDITPFQCAIGHDRVQVVQLFLKKFQPNLSVRCCREKTRRGLNAMELACSLQLVRIVELLLSLRADFYRSLLADDVFWLFELAQAPNHELRAGYKYVYTNVQPTIHAGPHAVTDVICALENFFSPRWSLASLIDSRTGQNLLHVASDTEAIKYLISKGVDLHALDFQQRTPFHCATEALLHQKLEPSGMVAIFNFCREKFEPNTYILRQALRALAELRVRRTIPFESEPGLQELEKQVWDTASKEDIEARYVRTTHGYSSETDLIGVLWEDVSSSTPFLNAFQQKRVTYSPNMSWCVSEYVFDGLNPKRRPRGTMSKTDCLRAAQYALQSHLENCQTVKIGTATVTTRGDLLFRICLVLWAQDSENELTEEYFLLLSIANIMVEGFFKLGLTVPFQIACRDMPGRLPPTCREQVKALTYKVQNALSDLMGEDEDMTDSFNLLVRPRLQQLGVSPQPNIPLTNVLNP